MSPGTGLVLIIVEFAVCVYLVYATFSRDCAIRNKNLYVLKDYFATKLIQDISDKLCQFDGSFQSELLAYITPR